MKKTDKNNEVELREHSFDGIQEFDQKLPNWWLFTLFVTIIFAIIFWFMTRQVQEVSDGAKVEMAMKQLEADRLSSSAATLDDETLIKMSQNEVFVKAGAAHYQTNCVACHGANLEGGIGFKLSDSEWVHGGKPTEIFYTINSGVLEKGMPAWGSVLGPKRVSEVVAFLLSKQE
jgi:cytochrome c oxidase cbb3-type subunit 3